jgi:acyl-CoA thioester hydrolase
VFGKLRGGADGRGLRLQDRLQGPGEAAREAGRAAGYAPPVPEPYTHTIRVRFGECDPQGVVFNANWLAYFDVVITELYREHGGEYKEMLAAGTDMVVAEVTLRLLGPARFDDDVDFEVTISRLGTTSVSTHIEAAVDGSPVASGDMRHVFIDPDTKAKKEMPDHVRAGLERVAAPGPVSTPPSGSRR